MDRSKNSSICACSSSQEQHEGGMYSTGTTNSLLDPDSSTSGSIDGEEDWSRLETNTRLDNNKRTSLGNIFVVQVFGFGCRSTRGWSHMMFSWHCFKSRGCLMFWWSKLQDKMTTTGWRNESDQEEWDADWVELNDVSVDVLSMSMSMSCRTLSRLHLEILLSCCSVIETERTLAEGSLSG